MDTQYMLIQEISQMR